MWMGDIKTKDKSKLQILDAAMHVFVKSGYSKTTMDDIVEHSGLSKGAIYHYYSSINNSWIAVVALKLWMVPFK